MSRYETAILVLPRRPCRNFVFVLFCRTLLPCISLFAGRDVCRLLRVCVKIVVTLAKATIVDMLNARDVVELATGWTARGTANANLYNFFRHFLLFSVVLSQSLFRPATTNKCTTCSGKCDGCPNVRCLLYPVFSNRATSANFQSSKRKCLEIFLPPSQLSSQALPIRTHLLFHPLCWSTVLCRLISSM